MFSLFAPEKTLDRTTTAMSAGADQAQLIAEALTRRADKAASVYPDAFRAWWEHAHRVAQSSLEAFQRGQALEATVSYWTDAGQRWVLFLDALRERGDIDISHEAAGTPPVLIYDAQVIVDGKSMKRPVNYFLLRIVPPSGQEVDDRKQPFIIIDPRAGHGAGIGGFKPDSQVGVALRRGHPVYFVAFRPHPEPGQTLADVTKAEAEFVREVVRRHPDAPRPIVVGNCQGGWATMILAATNPDLTGPVVINGAPLSYWSGRVGENPMRYNGGLLGGILPALLLADLGGGEFDGAHLVSNFEMLNPSRNFFGKYYDLFDNVEKGKARFLEFERWWGGFHFMSEAEIHWIVDQLFIGNKLARNEARLESGRHIDLKNIRSPIIVFASHGDNITPPQQALNWITDAYTDEEEIRVRGQRIVYMVHDKVGHLGIFVSSSVAQKEHAEVASTLQTIEALAPGLYEMVIEEMREQGVDAQFVVSFHERSLQHIRDLDDGRHVEDKAFAAVERLSEFGAEVYDMFGRPMVRAAVSGPVATAVRDLNPARTQRLVFSSRNPTMRWVPGAAEIAAAERKPVAPNNPLREAEKLWASGVEQSLDLMRDVRDAAYEVMFLSIFASPTMQHLGQPRNFVRTKKDREELRWLPEVQAILLNVDRGGYVEAVIRMLILLAQARGSVRRSRLERSAQVLTADAPFSDLGAARRAAIIHEQSVIVEFVPNEAMQALPRLLVGEDERRKALATVEYIAGPLEEMEPHTIHAITSFRKVLGLPEFAVISADEPDQQRKLRTARKASPDNGSTAAE